MSNNKKLMTTVVGSMPKPSYLQVPCWVENCKENLDSVGNFEKLKKEIPAEELEKQLDRAVKEVVDLQNEIGIDVVSNGEMERVSYVWRFLRTLQGIDFENLAYTTVRNGKWSGKLPRIVGKIIRQTTSDYHTEPSYEWQRAQQLSKAPVKFTLPGPLTIMDTTKNEFYDTEMEVSRDLAKCVNEAVLGLVKQGCKYIQIDEPVLVRYPEKANKFVIDALKACFDGVPDDVIKMVHVCCGYPTYLDQTDYEKAEQDAYIRIAEKMDNAGFDVISIEDAHRRNDKELFQLFKKTKIMLGVIDVVSSHVESVDEIKEHITDVLKYLPRERLLVAPDCGLIFLTDELLKSKLKNMVEAAKQC